MTLALDRILDNARIHLPSALDDALRLELFNVLDEFFRATSMWQEDVTFNVRPGVISYEIANFDPGQMIALMGIVNGDLLPISGTMREPGTIIVLNDPSKRETYTATVALTVVDPTDRDGNPECPEWILQKYFADVLEGLLGRMMAQPAKPYSSERLAIYHTRKFRNVMANARVEAWHHNLYGGQRWQFPQSFAVRRR
jgi:hypothetical protein